MAFNTVQVAQVTGYAAGAVAAQGVGAVTVGPNVGVALGGAAAGAIYAPQPGDLVLVAKGPGGEDIVLGGYLDPTKPPAWLPTLAAGEFAIGNVAGAYIKLTAVGDIALVPASGRNVLLGTGAATVARVGDPVSGTAPSGGGAISASIGGSTSEAKA